MCKETNFCVKKKRKTKKKNNIYCDDHAKRSA